MAPKKGKKPNGKKKGDKKKNPKNVAQKPEVSYSNVQRFIFSNEDTFLAYLSELDFNTPIYVLFRSIPVRDLEGGLHS